MGFHFPPLFKWQETLGAKIIETTSFQNESASPLRPPDEIYRTPSTERKHTTSHINEWNTIWNMIISDPLCLGKSKFPSVPYHFQPMRSWLNQNLKCSPIWYRWPILSQILLDHSISQPNACSAHVIKGCMLCMHCNHSILSTGRGANLLFQDSIGTFFLHDPPFESFWTKRGVNLSSNVECYNDPHEMR